MNLTDHRRSRSHHPGDARRGQALHDRRAHHPDLTTLLGWLAMKAEADIFEGRWDEQRWALRMGLTGADTEDVTEVCNYDATVLGIPFDGSATYRPGTRFGPQGMRKISGLYIP